MILIDSVFANLVDQLRLNPAADKYYMRKWNRRVDGNHVLLGNWTFVDIADPEGVQVKSLADTGIPNPAAQATGDPAAQDSSSAARPNSRANSSAGQTYTPYGQTQNTLNAAQQLQAALGLRK